MNPRSDSAANPSSNSEVRTMAAMSSVRFMSRAPGGREKSLAAGDIPLNFPVNYRYVCHSAYYEGRHTDWQMIFLDMAKGADSKGKTPAAAAKLFRQQGYHGTALQDILAAGGSPRGSLYFHFPKGKEEIGENALAIAGEAVRQGIVRAAEASESAEMFLTHVARAMAADLEKSDYQEGCPIATTALETSAQSEVLGDATSSAVR